MEDILSIDNGEKYGTREGVKEIYKAINQELESLIRIISSDEKTNLRIGDWGGGNGIVAKKVIEVLTLYKKNPKVTIIDIDDEKFVESKNIENVCKDIRIYTPASPFDYSISRNVLHYMNGEDNELFVKNMLKNTSFYSLIVNFTIDDERRKEWGMLENRLLKYEIKRKYSTHGDIQGIVRNSGGRITEEQTFILRDFDFELFYKNRFNLPEHAVEELKKTGVLEKGEYCISTFLIK